MTYQDVFTLRTSARAISPRLVEVVVGLYDELWDKSPSGPHVTKTRNWAARKGFALPLAWDDDTIDDPTATPWAPEAVAVAGTHPDGPSLADRRRAERKAERDKPPLIDEIAVELAMRGDRVKLTLPERREAIGRLNGLRLNDGEIAERLHIRHDLVTADRLRHNLGKAAA